MKISVIIPVYDEEESVSELHAELDAVLNDLEWDSEVIMVDDGSSDRSAAVIADISARDPRVRLVKFARNFGQTAAILAGIVTWANCG